MRLSERGDAAVAALWAAGIMTGVAFLMAGIVASGRTYTRERALIDEANIIINAVRAYQADEAAPLSDYRDAAEVGWPGTDRTSTPRDTDCGDALDILAGGGGRPNYISADYQDPPDGRGPQSLVVPTLRWVTSCDGPAGQQFRLQLTSFGPAEICSEDPETRSGPCPARAVAQNLAGATSGAVRDENPGGPSEDFDSSNENFYVDWTVWRGAEYPALNRLSEMLLWKDYQDALQLGIERDRRPTTAFSGIRLGGWRDEDPDDNDVRDGNAVTYWANSPPNLARFIGGVNEAEDTNNDDVIDAGDGAGPRPLAPPLFNRIDGRSFAMFYRATRHDPFADAAPVFQLTDRPCPDPVTGGVLTPPTWMAMVESVRIAFRGFSATGPAVANISLDATGVDRTTLIPTGWQVFDAADADPLAYRPEIRVDVMTVLAGGIRNPNTITEMSCPPEVVHGLIDSRDTGNVNVFNPVTRRCAYTNRLGTPTPDQAASAPLAFVQALPAIPHTDLAVFQPAGRTAVQAVRLSAIAYCPMPVAGGPPAGA